jgi:hypothetical protein
MMLQRDRDARAQGAISKGSQRGARQKAATR